MLDHVAGDDLDLAVAFVMVSMPITRVLAILGDPARVISHVCYA
jgi:hypothetical protein